MSRPTKSRRVCSMPRCTAFHSETAAPDKGRPIELSVEEFEAIRLIDYLGLNQEECAAQMEVARTTVQRIYNQARKKVAIFMVEGSCLRIRGGVYKLCGDKCNKRKVCSKQQNLRTKEREATENE